ncbi:MAG: aldehyde ferredoxin oxidoreductase family protein, partial [Nanoarchaeota archaeon]|nr:aldehyde ferredoxin oxidoreductase family protein [Nanoarchaeota archaeon]
MKGGYTGKILRVNLSTKEITTEDLTEKMAKFHIGARGLATRIAYDEIPCDADPSGPENKIIMATGPLSGTRVIASGKTTFVGKSPQTNGYGSSNVGGHLAEELKFAGYDAVVVEGASKKLCYLYIEDDKVEIRDAKDYKGAGCISGERKMKDDLGDDVQIAIVGPAAENSVAYSCISHDFGRQAGRAGLGTIMGNKNLKAIAIKGSKGIEVHDKKRLDKIVRQMFKDAKEHPDFKAWQLYGTTNLVSYSNHNLKSLPTRNFQSGHFENGDNIRAEVMRRKIVRHDKACGVCPMACGKYSYSKSHNICVEGPEYETIGMLGSNLGIDNIEDIAYLNYVTDELGLDTISAGNVIGHLIEAYKEGKVTDKEIGKDMKGLDWGKTKEVELLLNKIAHKRGIGKLLAKGVKRVSEVLGTQEYAMHVKGVEISAYESRRRPANKLAYGTASIGGHHNDAWAIVFDAQGGKDKAEKVIELQHL